jgi:L-2-hydroxyglutarate oxidase
VDRAGKLVDDFRIERGERSLHVLNAPSPAATASLAIGEHLAAELLALPAVAVGPRR